MQDWPLSKEQRRYLRSFDRYIHAWSIDDEKAMIRTSNARARNLQRMGIEPREKYERRNRIGGPAYELADADWLRSRYWDDGRTLEEIAAECECSQWRVSRAMIHHGISRRRRGPRI